VAGVTEKREIEIVENLTITSALAKSGTGKDIFELTSERVE
jgi:hypothetical protein